MRSLKFWQKLIIVVLLVGAFFVLGQQSTRAIPDATYSDVPSNYWAYTWISKFGNLGITTGCGGTKFCPENNVRRSEMAVFLVRMWTKLSTGSTSSNAAVYGLPPVVNTSSYVRNSYWGDDLLWFNDYNARSFRVYPTSGDMYLGSSRGDGDVFIQDTNGSNRFTINGSSGSFYASGTKSALVSTETNGEVLMYAMESPENWFEDFGTASLTKGEVVVNIDPVFAETVNLNADYHVFTTPVCDKPVVLFVSEKMADHFTVSGVSLDNEFSQCQFDYRVVAKRIGYEDLRLTPLSESLFGEVEAEPTIIETDMYEQGQYKQPLDVNADNIDEFVNEFVGE